MKRVLRWTALGTALVALAGWLIGGAHRGWTRTSVAVEKTDEVTGLRYQEYERRFVPGLELLAAAMTFSGLLGVASFLRKSGRTNR